MSCIIEGLKYCDIQMYCKVTAVQTDGRTRFVANEQLCGHIVCLATRVHMLMQEAVSVLSLLYDEDQLPL